MTNLEKYEAVNHTESLEELAEVIKSMCPNGFIEGRAEFQAIAPMVNACLNPTIFYPTIFTRNWGIRQQALMLLNQGACKPKQR